MSHSTRPELIWTEDVVQKILLKHNVTIGEVQEAFDDPDALITRGRWQTRLIFGRTEEGRYLPDGYLLGYVLVERDVADLTDLCPGIGIGDWGFFLSVLDLMAPQRPCPLSPSEHGSVKRYPSSRRDSSMPTRAPAEVGMPLDAVDTPALLLDLDAFE